MKVSMKRWSWWEDKYVLSLFFSKKAVLKLLHTHTHSLLFEPRLTQQWWVNNSHITWRTNVIIKKSNNQYAEDAWKLAQKHSCQPSFCKHWCRSPGWLRLKGHSSALDLCTWLVQPITATFMEISGFEVVEESSSNFEQHFQYGRQLLWKKRQMQFVVNLLSLLWKGKEFWGGLLPWTLMQEKPQRSPMCIRGRPL